MKKMIIFLLFCVMMSSCSTSYYDPPYFQNAETFTLASIYSKTNIIGMWKLISMENIERYRPNIEQYIVLKNNKNINYGEKMNNIKFINFQMKVKINDSVYIDSLCSCNGDWRIISYGYWGNYYEEISGNGVLCLDNEFMNNVQFKIEKHTPNKLVLAYPKPYLPPVEASAYKTKRLIFKRLI